MAYAGAGSFLGAWRLYREAARSPDKDLAQIARVALERMTGASR